jgi:cytoskeletal protein CcmA (bactofilin family)
MRKAILGMFLVLTFLFTLTAAAFAVEPRKGSRLTVNAGETVDDDLILSGVTVVIDGNVRGDVFAFADSVTVNGTINGNLVTLAQSLDVNGQVTGTVFAAADDLQITGRIDRSLVTLGGRLAVDDRATVGHSWLGLGDELLARGSIGRIAGMVLLTLFPRLRFSFHKAVVEKPWQSPLMGLLLLLVVPIASIVVMVTVVGIPMGLLSLLLYPLAIYFSQVLLSFTVGRLIADRWEWLGRQNWAIIFLFGSLVTTLVNEVPGTGFATSLLAVAYGLGGLYYAYTQSRTGDL